MECAVILEEDIVDVCGCSLPLRGRLSMRAFQPRGRLGGHA